MMQMLWSAFDCGGIYVMHATMSVHSTSAVSQRAGGTNHPKTSTPHNSTIMSPADEAIEAIESLQSAESFRYKGHS
jgi:hypothetical protein